MNFEINLIFLIKPFFNMIKKSWQKLKYLKNENSYYDEMLLSKAAFKHKWFYNVNPTSNGKSKQEKHEKHMKSAQS